MTVGAAHAYTPPLNSHEMYAARTAAKGEQKSTSTAAPTSTAAVGVTGQTTDSTVFGTTGSRLSAETTAELIKTTQQASAPADGSTLQVATQHHLDEIANNSEYAAKQSNLVGTRLTPIVSTGGLLSSLRNSNSLAEKEAILGQMDQINAANLTAFAPREVLYESKKAEGVPPAQIFADILAFNATQTEYNSLADKMGGKPDGYTTSMLKAEHAYLQQAIAQANSSEATGELS